MRQASLVVIALALACGPSTAGNPSLTPVPPGPVTDPKPPNPGPAYDKPVSAKPAPEPPAQGPLVLDGTPEIPAALVQRLDQYLNTRSASVGDISDDGKRMLVGTRFAETSQVHVVDGPMQARFQLTFRAEPARGPKFVPGRKDAIVYSSDIGGNEQHQLFRMDLKSGRTTQLTTKGSRNGSFVFSRDGRKLAFMSNRRNLKDFDIWVSDGKSAGSAKLVVEGKGYFYPRGFSRDGSRLLIGEYISINESHLYMWDFKRQKLSQLDPPQVKAAYKVASFGRDNNTVYISTDREGEFAELYEGDIANNKWRPLTGKIPWDVTGATLSDDGRTLAVAVNEASVSRLYLLNTRTRRLQKVKALGDRMVSGMKWAKKAGTLALTLNSATMPGDAFVYDPRRRKLTRWTRSELGGIDEASLASPSFFEYPSHGGKKIPAFIYKPEGKGPFPVVVAIHGGPESQARPYFSSLTQYLVSESKIAVIYPNVRGSNGYGKTYVKLDNGFGREGSVKDIGALLDWIDKQPDLDGKRVAVRGGSYGGYMVLASLVHYSDRLAAGVDVVGISNFVTFLKNTADYRRDLRRAEYGDERDPKMKAFLERISPLNQVDKIRAPLFVAQGANDPRVPASEAKQIVDAVRKTGKDVWYFLALNEGHGFRKKSNRDVFTQLTVMFLEKHLR
jgi:dipeptidyl aminopeptidase/acylaminoacyl peptidase